MGTIHKSVGIVPNLDKKVGQKVRRTSQESRSKSEKNKSKAKKNKPGNHVKK